MSKIQAVRGMNDILPEQTPVWQYLEGQVAQLLKTFGYAEIRMPLVEPTVLFKRSVGEATDIVEKEMYSFDDRNGDNLSLRPEGTASCVRAAEQHGLLFNQVQRLWYQGPMFRHERPQKGRYRQFFQIGVETFGMPGPDIDAEIILLTAQLWQRLGISEYLTLEINSLGTADERARYKAALVEYLSQHQEALDEDSRRRLSSNPLRVLDSKDAKTQALLAQAPSLADYLDEGSKQHFDQLLAQLQELGIAYQVNPKLVRGLDYYSKTVFEWTTDQLGAQGTVCAGGRYDGLVEQLGGKPTPAVGFAMGLERLILLLTQLDKIPPQVQQTIDCYLTAVGDAAQSQSLALAKQLREGIPGLRLLMHCGGGSFKSQMKKADKSGADFVILLGDDEVAQQTVSIKGLRDNLDQTSLPRQELVAFVAKLING